MGLQIVRFLAVILTALAFVPVGAHIFELPNEIGLSQEQYLTVQGIFAAGRCSASFLSAASLPTSLMPF